MAGGYRLELDPAWESIVLDRPEVEAALVGMRDAGAAHASRAAPVGPTKQYRGSIVKGPLKRDRGRPSTWYGSTDPAAHLVEYGSVKNRPYRTLSQSALAVDPRAEIL